jgi:flagellar hook protein FlgE
MLRSLFTGISGLGAHQQMLDVTANNIANVNTTGYKSSHTVFEDTLNQTISGGSGGGAAAGGTNPIQVGLGVKVAGTAMNFTQGSNQSTGVRTNMLINGDGFFTVTTNGTDKLYTRAGNFQLDNQGHLVTPDGAMLLDTTGAPITLPLTSVSPAGTWTDYNIQPDGTITGIDTAGNPVTTPSIKIGLATFPNPGGLLKVGNSEFQQTASSGNASASGVGTITTGYVEMSNVDLSQELTNLIIAQRGFQANSKVITTSDEVLQTLVNLKQ